MLNDIVQELYNMSNRKERRKMLYFKPRQFTQKGYEYGLKIGSRNYKMVHAIAKRQA